MGAAERWAHHLLRGPNLPYQSFHRDGSRDDCATHARLHYGDRDGDGFQEYQTRSPAGYENMAWKDSGDCVVYLDGSLVKGPKALCELQGYVYSAWIRIAEVFDALGDGDRAEELRAKAAALFERFIGILG